MRLLYTNLYRDVIVHLMWMLTNSRKGKDDHCWMKASNQGPFNIHINILETYLLELLKLIHDAIVKIVIDLTLV